MKMNERLNYVTREHVLAAAAQLAAEPINKWAVRVAGAVFPVKQIYAEAANLADGPWPTVTRNDFITNLARDRLRRLGFDVFATDDPASRQQNRVAAGGTSGAGCVRTERPASSRIAGTLATSTHILRGSAEFERRERRDAMYRVATFLVEHFWGKTRDMADGMGVLLLTWNQAFYRYGPFDFDRLERCVERSLPTLKQLRRRDILTFQKDDESTVEQLFTSFLDALRIATGRLFARTSPVAVAKALHLLAPAFFPLWDDKIARAYRCHYAVSPVRSYITFMWITKEIAERLDRNVTPKGKTLIKLIDEYNYARFTQHWI